MFSPQLITILKAKIDLEYATLETCQPEVLYRIQGRIMAYKHVIRILQKDFITWKVNEANLTKDEMNLIQGFIYGDDSLNMDGRLPIMNIDEWDEIMEYIDSEIRVIQGSR